MQIHERENRVWNVVLLEIIHLLLHRHDPAAVFECVDASKRESKAKAFSSALSKCSLKPNLPSRHGRFGGKPPRSNTRTYTLVRAHPSERNGTSASKASGSIPAEGASTRGLDRSAAAHALTSLASHGASRRGRTALGRRIGGVHLWQERSS